MRKRGISLIVLVFTLITMEISFFNFKVLASSFDASFYATRYPDVKKAFGTDSKKLYEHYISYGINEGRLPYEGATPGEKVDGIAESKMGDSGLVAIKKLNNYKSIKKKMTDAEFEAAYNSAAVVATPLLGKSRPEQLSGIMTSLREMVDSGQVSYSTDLPHYNDPYGYFVSGVASCAGCARATGLCLNMLGIPYEHVNENKWSHQWCRVNIDGTYWICDPFGLYCGPEPAPYQHP